MELRYFQIIVPAFAFLFILWQAKEYRKANSNVYEAILIFIFWISASIFTMFPDFFSRKIARVFGIEDDVNAIIFFALGLIFYFQFQLYKMLKQQDKYLTELARKIALEGEEY